MAAEVSEEREVARLARGVLAAVRLRLLAGAVNAAYSPTDVATIVSEVIDEQIARLEAAALRKPAPAEPRAPDPSWQTDAEGYVVEPLSYENREGDPAFNGAFDKW